MTPRLSRSDARGSDLSVFGDFRKPGGSLELFQNHTSDINSEFPGGIERIVHEEAYPEMGSILLIEQEGDRVDYAPRLKRLEEFEAILLQRRRYTREPRKREVLFDRAKGIDLLATE